MGWWILSLTDEANPSISFKREAFANIKLAWPIAAAQLVQMAIHIADQVMVGRLGSVDLAAISLGIYIISVPQLFGIGLLSAISAVGAQAYGAGDEEKLARVIRGGMVIALLLSIPNMLLIVGVPYILPAFGLFLGRYLGGNPEGYDPEMLSLIWDYIAIGVISMPPFLFFTALRNFITIKGKTIPITIIVIISLGIGIITNYAFIYGNWHMPSMGIGGAGLSLVTLNWFQFFALCFYITRQSSLYKYKPFRIWQGVDIALIKELLLVGLPASASILFETSLFICSSFLMAIFGQAEAAAYGATLSICTAAFMVPWSMGQSATVLVGRAIGAGLDLQARMAGIAAMSLGTFYMMLSGIALFLWGSELLGFFLDSHEAGNEEAIMIGLAFIPIAALFQIVDGLQVTAISALRGAKDTKVPMLITGVSYWIFGMGGALLFGFGMNGGSRGVFWGLAIGLSMAALLLTWRFFRFSRHHFQYA